MNPPERFDPKLLESLSAYLDGRLEGAEKAALEARLNKEESLRRQLAELRSVRDSLRRLPLHKPPRSLALTPAMAGKAAIRAGVYSPRRMALGSALASLAFVCVLSIDFFSRGAFLSAAPRAVSVNEAINGPQSTDGIGVEKSSATQPTAAAVATMLPVLTVSGYGLSCDNCTPTGTPAEVPSPSRLGGGGCGDCVPTGELAVNPPQVASVSLATTPQPRAVPDFLTIAPYLEVFLGLAAVLLAAMAALAAMIVRRRR